MDVNSGIPAQLTLSLLRSKISDSSPPVINSKVGDKDGGEVVVAIETKKGGKKYIFTNISLLEIGVFLNQIYFKLEKKSSCDELDFFSSWNLIFLLVVT